jgi:hypothetical protein
MQSVSSGERVLSDLKATGDEQPEEAGQKGSEHRGQRGVGKGVASQYGQVFLPIFEIFAPQSGQVP